MLNSARPRQFEDGVLTLEFAGSAKVQKKMCESNGRAEQIESLLSELLATPTRLKLEVADDQQSAVDTGVRPPGVMSRKKNEIINDPAVKTVLTGLDATITNIEEGQ